MSLPWRVLRSKRDESVNFIASYKGGSIEARYVRRTPDKVSAYLSSHSGCNQRCKFCWLTASGQTSFDHVPIDLYAEQLDRVLSHARFTDSQFPLGTVRPRVNVNFMARGEPLANRHLMSNYRTLHETLQTVVESHGYNEMKVNISTIMPPMTQGVNLDARFSGLPVYLYYSLYSVNPEFRKKWIPNARAPDNALSTLKDFQVASGMPLTIHFALIRNENDNLEDIQNLIDTVKRYSFDNLKFNVVKFNPHSSSEHTESVNTQKIFEMLNEVSSGTTCYTGSRIVPRVGEDVYASCGMFTE